MPLLTFLTMSAILRILQVQMALSALRRTRLTHVVAMGVGGRVEAFVAVALAGGVVERGVEGAYSAVDGDGVVVPMTTITSQRTLHTLAIQATEPLTTITTDAEVFLRHVSNDYQSAGAGLAGPLVDAGGTALGAVQAGGCFVVEELAVGAEAFGRVEHAVFARVGCWVVIVIIVAGWA